MELNKQELLYTAVNEYRLPLAEALVAYIVDRAHCGHFLTAILSNNLVHATDRADEVNKKKISDYVVFLYNNAPGDCWGSVESVKRWLSHEETSTFFLTIEEWRLQRSWSKIKDVGWIAAEKCVTEHENEVLIYPGECYLDIDPNNNSYAFLVIESQQFHGLISDMEWVLYNKWYKG